MKTIEILVQGKTWGGGLGEMEYSIREYNIVHAPDSCHAGQLYIKENQSLIDAIEDWLCVNTGDFQSIEAWEAWEREEIVHIKEIGSRGEMAYMDPEREEEE